MHASFINFVLFSNVTNFRDDTLLSEPILIPQRQFVKNKRSEIFTVYRPKKYRALYEKGQILPEMKVAPYGWRE